MHPVKCGLKCGVLGLLLAEYCASLSMFSTCRICLSLNPSGQSKRWRPSLSRCDFMVASKLGSSLNMAACVRATRALVNAYGLTTCCTPHVDTTAFGISSANLSVTVRVSCAHAHRPRRQICNACIRIRYKLKAKHKVNCVPLNHTCKERSCRSWSLSTQIDLYFFFFLSYGETHLRVCPCTWSVVRLKPDHLAWHSLGPRFAGGLLSYFIIIPASTIVFGCAPFRLCHFVPFLKHRFQLVFYFNR